MIKRYITELVRKGVWYWAKIAILIVVGVYAGEWLAERYYWFDQRSVLQNRLPRKPHPQRAVLVVIVDEEYWKGHSAFFLL